LEFLSNDAGELEGLGDAGIETYKDNPYASVARECGQNSNDAALRRPVTVSYDLINIPSSQIPALPKLKLAVQACLDAATKSRDEKTTDFFKQAKKVLEENDIKCLRVTDSNTTGLIGPCEPGTPFHSLVKAAGISTKESDTSSGSFGIGKNAAFAVSDLQTVFYSTVYLDTAGVKQFLAQGKTKLISHIDEKGQSRRATGYWGNPAGFLPVSDIAATPEWLRRSDVGTSVFALGFREVPHWEYRMAYSLVANFFIAMHRERMRFEVNNGAIVIEAANVASLLHDSSVEQAANDDDQLEDLQFARDLFRCLISSDTIEKRTVIPELGEISVRILVKEGLPKRVAIVRNGMMITDNLKHFGDKFSRFPLYRDFVALVEPLDDLGSALIKKLENPRHDEVSAERIPDPAKKAAAKRAMTRLAKEIREIIRSETAVTAEGDVALDEMAEFFADGDRGDIPPPADAEDDLSTIRYQPAKTKQERKTRTEGPGKEGGAGGKGSGGGGGGGAGPGTGRGSGGAGQSGRVQAMHFESIRHTRAPDQQMNGRTIHFTPAMDGIAKVTLEAVGIDNNEKLTVVHAEPGIIANGEILLRLEGGKRTAVRIELSEDYDGPIEISGLRISDLPEK
jgi:uncharacterized membrane protein YgcG